MESGFLYHLVWKVYHLVIHQSKALSFGLRVNGKEILLSEVGPFVHLGLFITMVTRF